MKDEVEIITGDRWAVVRVEELGEGKGGGVQVALSTTVLSVTFRR